MPIGDELDAYYFFEDRWDSYQSLYDSFEYEIPEQFNIADYVCDRWAEDKGRVALFSERAGGERTTLTFWQLQESANQMANYLREVGVEAGDRVAMTGSQKPEILISMVAALKVGAVAVPVSGMYGLDGLEYRLRDSGADVFVADSANIEIIRELGSIPPTEVLVVDTTPESGETAFWTAIESHSSEFSNVRTRPEDPAFVIYTSGTTGQPKGVVHSHQALLGQLPGFVFKHMNMAVNDDDVIWILVEWSWIGILGFIFPALFYGRPILGYARTEFDPTRVLELIATYGVTFAALSPTAIRMMKQSASSSEYDLSCVRVLSIGGEKASEAVLEWIDYTFDDPVKNVGWGQTECILPVGECEALGMSREGSMGVPVPGQEATVVDPETAEETVPRGDIGELAIRYEGNPICFKHYLNKPEKTAEKVTDGWLLSEDLVHVDEDGFFHFHSRKDDVIISSGYRIGPEEIEESLSKHDAVKEVGVIGVPHDTRGEIPKAFVELADGNASPSDSLKEELQDYVKHHLAKYEYPREIEFIEEVPTTTSRKTQRATLREMEGIN